MSATNVAIIGCGVIVAHVTEIMCATTESAKTGRSIEMDSTFTPPEPMEWAL